MKLRLDKYLTEMGCGTRSQVKKEILKGSVSVNGEIAKKAERKVDTEKDEIIFKGEKIFYAGYEYFMLNKPAGVVSATEDKKERTVIDLIKESKRKDLFPANNNRTTHWYRALVAISFPMRYGDIPQRFHVYVQS